MCRQDKLVLHIGGVEFQLYHDKGETDDHTWVYVPRHNGPADPLRRAGAHPAPLPAHMCAGPHCFFFFLRGARVVQPSAPVTCSQTSCPTAGTRKRSAF